MEVKEALKVIGFNDKQVKAYLALIALGPTSAYAVAAKSGLKKPTAYVIIQELIEKGAVYQIPRVKKQLFQARPPEELFSEAEVKLSQAKEKIPVINALASGHTYKPQVYYYEGISGVKDALKFRIEELKGKEIVGFYAKTSPKILSKTNNYLEYNNALKKHDVKVRGIAPQHPSLKEFRETDQEYGRQIKSVAPEEYNSDIAILISDDFVIFSDPVNNQSTIMDNRDIALTLRSIFEMVWKNIE